MATTLRPFAALLMCAHLLGCGTPNGGVVRKAGQGGPEPLSGPGQAGTEAAVYQVGTLPGPGRTARTGRYSYVDVGAQAAQVDPMLAVIDVHVPPDIATVEDAVNYLLRRSGFNLLPAGPGESAVAYLLGQPLPDIHRHLGPVSLRDALLTLGGKAFMVNVDYVYRKVGYQVSPAYAGNSHS
jgi:type IV pili sensor histidine kinase/response regulator